MIRKLRVSKGWNQDQFADQINQVIEANPELKKATKKNPSGLVDQQTAQRVEAGIISLDERWLKILHKLFGVTPNELLGIFKAREEELLSLYRRRNEKKQAALLDLLASEDD